MLYVRISYLSIWLLVSFAAMLLYEISLIGYFLSGNTEENFYRSRFGIPVPLASLPVMGFLLLGIYGHVIWLIISVIILGVGHIGIHIQHVKKNQEVIDFISS